MGLLSENIKSGETLSNEDSQTLLRLIGKKYKANSELPDDAKMAEEGKDLKPSPDLDFLYTEEKYPEEPHELTFEDRAEVLEFLASKEFRTKYFERLPVVLRTKKAD